MKTMADYSQAETIRDKERKQQVIRQLQSVFRENTLMTAQKNAAANLKDIYIYIEIHFTRAIHSAPQQQDIKRRDQTINTQ